MDIEAGKTYEVLEGKYGYEKGEKFKVRAFVGERVDVLILPHQECREELEHFSEMKLREVEPSKPAHYDTAIDTIAFAKANFTPEQVEGFMRINAIKYLQRVKKGQVLEDLKKSRSYIDMLIEMEEGK